jgi:tetratricopeptide (TPR) repeat protein
MAKRDKYEEYRDVIYAMAAQIEIERKNFAAAQMYLSKAAKYKKDNVAANNNAYLQLADMAYERHDFKAAASFYDSIKFEGLPTIDAERIADRKSRLSRFVTNINNIERQDSLQRVAAMPEAERSALIKKNVRQLRKQQGLKEEESARPAGNTASSNNNDPFESKQPKGEWYFYNNTLKTAGATQFKQQWGNRPNVDNWRRFTDVTAQLRRNLPDNTRDDVNVTAPENNGAPTYDVLLSRLPLTPEKVQASNDSISKAMYVLGNIYVNDLEDFNSAIKTLEELRSRFRQGYDEDQVLFLLYYSYMKTGNTAKAAEVKRSETC